jgi:nucleotide-binding universal stress UspA family protein
MYRRVLVAIDDSPCCARALDEAIRLARAGSARVRLAHVVHVETYVAVALGTHSERLGEAWRRAGLELLEAAAARARQAGVEAETGLVESGERRIATALIDDARRWGADLIVMGTHGRHGLEHMMFGSVAEGVVRAAPVPVLLIRGEDRR